MWKYQVWSRILKNYTCLEKVSIFCYGIGESNACIQVLKYFLWSSPKKLEWEIAINSIATFKGEGRGGEDNFPRDRLKWNYIEILWKKIDERCLSFLRSQHRELYPEEEFWHRAWWINVVKWDVKRKSVRFSVELWELSKDLYARSR